MVERRPFLDLLAHLTLVLGVLIVAFPVWLALVALTHPPSAFVSGTVPLWFGDAGPETYARMFGEGLSSSGAPSLRLMLANSLLMALSIAGGKIAISITSALAIVWFRFPFRQLAFWAIFVTLMLPVEVRILPTYEVVADLGMLNSYAGLTVPLIASATFLYRQVFLSIPDELADAARLDRAGPLRFFLDILLPLTRTNTAALFVILFIYGWNQYLWPLLVTTDERYATVVSGVKRMADAADAAPQRNLVMAAVVLAMLPPVLVVIVMQRLFVRGLIESER